MTSQQHFASAANRTEEKKNFMQSGEITKPKQDDVVEPPTETKQHVRHFLITP